eukprot:928718_1
MCRCGSICCKRSIINTTNSMSLSHVLSLEAAQNTETSNKEIQTIIYSLLWSLWAFFCMSGFFCLWTVNFQIFLVLLFVCPLIRLIFDTAFFLHLIFYTFSSFLFIYSTLFVISHSIVNITTPGGGIQMTVPTQHIVTIHYELFILIFLYTLYLYLLFIVYIMYFYLPLCSWCTLFWLFCCYFASLFPHICALSTYWYNLIIILYNPAFTTPYNHAFTIDYNPAFTIPYNHEKK